MTTATPPAATGGTRRTLRFATLDDALNEAQRLADAEAGGRLGRCGNWTLGKTLNHLATWAEFAHTGYPPEVHAPLPVRLILRLFRNKILSQGMMTGVKIGKVPGGTLGLEDVPTDQGLARLRAAFAKLAGTTPTIPNPVFGQLTHEQWIQLNLRHAELHLGFQLPR